LKLRLRKIAALTLLALLVCAIAAMAIQPVRYAAFRELGELLVAADPITQADLIVVMENNGGAGVLEAADLVQRGMASRVAVFVDRPTREEREFVRRGLPYVNSTNLSIQRLRELNVDSIVAIPRAVAGTEASIAALHRWSSANRTAAIILVAFPDHTRRTRRIARRLFTEERPRVLVHSTRYGDYDPHYWWRSRGGVRTQIVEMQKLLLDVVRHPLS
jgi:hypothetical protein